MHSLFQNMVSAWSEMPQIMSGNLFDCVLPPRFFSPIYALFCAFHFAIAKYF